MHPISSKRPKNAGPSSSSPSLVKRALENYLGHLCPLTLESDSPFSNHTSKKGGVQRPWEAIRASGFKVSRSLIGGR